MLKLLKYLKPFTIMLIVAVVLLFGQAMADLALPDYMSDIVNVGIQQGGNENALPEVMRETDFEKIDLFLTEESIELVHNAYSHVDENSGIFLLLWPPKECGKKAYCTCLISI